MGQYYHSPHGKVSVHYQFHYELPIMVHYHHSPLVWCLVTTTSLQRCGVWSLVLSPLSPRKSVWSLPQLSQGMLSNHYYYHYFESSKVFSHYNHSTNVWCGVTITTTIFILVVCLVTITTLALVLFPFITYTLPQYGVWSLLLPIPLP